MECVFCKIVKGEVPCYKVYEDSRTIVFMDINPVNPGHLLVIPKKHYETIGELSEPLLKHLAKIVQLMYEKIMLSVEPDGINIVQNNGRVAGQIVPHVHIHIIPRFKGDDDHYVVKLKTVRMKEEQMRNIQERIKNA